MKKSSSEIADLARKVIRQEAESVANLTSFIDQSFLDVVDLIFNSKGRLIVTGIGKSAIIRKSWRP